MKIKIFALTHKKFEVPQDKMYQPLQVGREEKEDLGYLCDNTGDNISAENCYYSELTGLYWIWKNVHTYKYVGTCHYRRYLLNEQEKIFTEAEYLKLLKDYDLITTKRVVLNNSYHYGFATNHNIHALDMTGEVIKELYPEYYDTFVQLENGTETYFGNMIVTSKKWFDTYCEWLFHIFFEVQKRICLENGEDDYHKRVFGFISEFLLLVWVRVNHLKVYECKVGMLGEKAETREMKEQLAGYFFSMDVFGAKTYFAEMLKKAAGCSDGGIRHHRRAETFHADHCNHGSGITTDGALLSEKRKPFSGTYHFIYEIECSDTCIPERTGHRGGQALFDRAEC